ncbi:2-amino-4-hydroxy-6-hydroxymethyldihydropteridine diphosphokinase [Nitriliruptor alkaliphilus]|uniref:2-amino-4-hydroxy-6- hydroxymethyldihydropteridine diphosphokinase n=1 Tax=Nitriliruptor alkaliphilus TaxID=427918 RepID=UPI000695CC0F|nr:2-amino-4-hydroxy-6-hydroxymethyldihydropteridine diphosphokinase [Nitriliruptor alkaliphilus]
MAAELTFLSLGANVGDALETLTAAVYALDELDGVAVEEVSGVYETAPWPPPDDPRHVPQDPYLNLVVRSRTSLTPRALLHETQLLETAFGRDRATEQRWGPRPLDIDLLLVGDALVDTPELQLPHPRLEERAFVLVPLLEVWPGGTLPGGRRVTQALAALAPIEGIELVVRLADVPGRHLTRPEGPGAPPPSFDRPGLDPTPDGPRGDR